MSLAHVITADDIRSINPAITTDSSNGHISNGTTNGIKMQNGKSCATNGVSSTNNQYSFLQPLVDLMVTKVLEESTSRDSRVVEFKHPKELENLMDLSLNKSTSDEKLMEICKDVIRYSVKTGHPRFFNQLFGGLDQYSLGGAWLTETLNTSQYTYEVAPVFTLMEKTVLKKMLDLAGFPDGDAIFCPGGSVSNMYALNLARFQRWPEVKRQGMHGLPRLCVLTSDKAHYSLKKGAAFIGVGVDNVFPVKADSKGRMMPSALEERIMELKAEGYEPYVVNATSGTTVFGAYDPLDDIANVCQKYGIWMHVDAAWGGGVLLSRKYRSLMKGIDRADSLTWNPHKMMGPPLQCSAFLTKHKNLLPECHSAQATYLFQQDKFYDVSYDTGDKSIQCGRKVDVLKVWMLWKAKGDLQFEKDINNIMECGKYLAQLINERDGFRLLIEEPECTNVCFWYIPPSMRGQPEDQEWYQRLSKVAPVIKERMTMNGTMLIGYQPDGNTVNFFRMIVSNLGVTKEDMQFVVDEIDRLGSDL
ncbi:cysteine sulfinic acid decarboxylase-like isoform X1 [Argopecten irradians]|uniref:cysteine sulfinic acid decarboxylase-like isoform X1 n=1 Tax=Argopecten irradians TaxID=31199 RepID=UPI003715158D